MAYPTERDTSTVLLQRFLSGLLPMINWPTGIIERTTSGHSRGSQNSQRSGAGITVWWPSCKHRRFMGGGLCNQANHQIYYIWEKENSDVVDGTSDLDGVISNLQWSVDELTQKLTNLQTTGHQQPRHVGQQPRDRRTLLYLPEIWTLYRNECALNNQQPGSMKGGAWLNHVVPSNK